MFKRFCPRAGAEGGYKNLFCIICGSAFTMRLFLFNRVFYLQREVFRQDWAKRLGRTPPTAVFICLQSLMDSLAEWHKLLMTQEFS